jgi:hypothetical protein
MTRCNTETKVLVFSFTQIGLLDLTAPRTTPRQAEWRYDESMGLSKEQLKVRARVFRAGAKRGRACGFFVALVTMLSLTLGMMHAGVKSSGASYDPALDARCVKALKQKQKMWFEDRACHYDSREAHADFIAAELALRVRATHAPGPCVVLTLGLPTPGKTMDRQAKDMLVRGFGETAVDATTESKLGFWVGSMTDAGAFECATRTYVEEKSIPTLRATLESLGHKDAVVSTLWNDRRVPKQLDEEFDDIVKESPDAKLTVLINDAKRSQSQFAKFQNGLKSGKVSTLIWRREITSKAQKAALLSEVKLVARYGYSVYLAGAHENFLGKLQPTAYMRIDHGAWDDIFATPNTGIELTLVAVAKDDKFKTLLDTTFGLCPVKSSARNFHETQSHRCECDEAKFTEDVVDAKCSLESRLSLSASTLSWFSSLLGGRTKDDITGIEELDAALGGDYTWESASLT